MATKEDKRAALEMELTDKGFMTVADLIALLKTYPQKAPVTGYNSHEETGLVLPSNVRLTDDASVSYTETNAVGPFVDIMGQL